jgi:hypothetical protein
MLESDVQQREKLPRYLVTAEVEADFEGYGVAVAHDRIQNYLWPNVKEDPYYGIDNDDSGRDR